LSLARARAARSQAGLYVVGGREDLRRADGSPGPPGCTNHSIRRSGAQWAGRCGASEVAIRNAGRWRSMNQMVKYLGQGQEARATALESNGGIDPIARRFCFKEVSVAGVDMRDQM
jgi:hypothetical protein